MHVFNNKGEFNKIIPYMQAARENALIEFGSNDSVYVKYTLRLGVFSFRSGLLKQAEKFFIESKNLSYEYLFFNIR